MKTPFSSEILPPPPPPFAQPMLQTPHGCLFVSNIEKGERGLPFIILEGRIHTKGKKVGHCRVSQRLLSMIVACNRGSCGKYYKQEENIICI